VSKIKHGELAAWGIGRQELAEIARSEKIVDRRLPECLVRKCSVTRNLALINVVATSASENIK
jgi:hypothetical protein